MLMFLIYILSVFNSNQPLPREIKNKLEEKFSSYKRVEFAVVKSNMTYASIKLKENEDINVIGKTAYVPIVAVDKRGNVKRTTLSVRVKTYEDVYVAVRDIRRRKQLQATDFQLMEKEITSIRGKIVSSFGEILGKRAGRFIRKGAVLTVEALEKTPVIFPGDKLSAMSIVGSVQISLSAFAKQEGSIGDIIRIRTSSRKVYKAEIIDSKNVLIIE